ncbi:MAG: hypothetical protein B7733_05080 [Myxococcales bacterium FL481]|nr:MAG: hypothetical protein B7733_05080 [Myxococcales bacterium FL481]
MPNASLQEKLAEQHDAVVSACEELVQRQVQQKRGLTGAGIKAALKVATAVRPSFVREVVIRLVPEFAKALQPQFERCTERATATGGTVGDAFREELSSRPGEAADALLGVTDARVAAAAPTVRKAYDRLRGSAKTHVEAAMPDAGATLARFV